MSMVRELAGFFRFPSFASPEEEEAFLRAADADKLTQRTYFMFIATLTFMVFGILDPFMAGDAAVNVMIVRIVTVFTMMLIWLRFLKSSCFRMRERWILLFGITVATGMIVISIIAAPPAADFYPFTFGVIMVFGHCLVVPRFHTIAALCFGSYVGYWASVPWSQTSMEAICANAFLMSVITLSVVIGAFTREKLERQTGIAAADLSRARQEALALRDQALEANRAKSHFLANVSHELRTPMNAIMGFSEIMRDGIFGEIQPRRYAEYVGNIHQSGGLLLSNINDLLDFSRIELDKLGWHESVFEIGSAIRTAIDTCAAGFQHDLLHFEPGGPELPRFTLGDEARLTQALINIIGNAIKFSEPGEPIRVRVEGRAEGGLALVVADRGCGIPPDDLAVIREPFRQVSADSWSTKKGGLGLGLSISSDIARRFDAALLIESEVGTGTTVSIILPPARLQTSADTRASA